LAELGWEKSGADREKGGFFFVFLCGGQPGPLREVNGHTTPFRESQGARAPTTTSLPAAARRRPGSPRPGWGLTSPAI